MHIRYNYLNRGDILQDPIGLQVERSVGVYEISLLWATAIVRRENNT